MHTMDGWGGLGGWGSGGGGRSPHEPLCQGFIPPDERGKFGVARHSLSSPFSDRDGCLSSLVMASVMNGLHRQGKKGKGGLVAL